MHLCQNLHRRCWAHWLCPVQMNAATAALLQPSSIIPSRVPLNSGLSPSPVTIGAGNAHVDSAAVRTLLTADLDLLFDFVSEVKEHIDNINDRLLTLENNPGDSDLLNAVFRVFHTIKGAAGFLALDEISRLSHITESLLDSARKGDLQLKGGSIDVVFEAVDEMKNLVGTIEAGISSGENSYLPSRTVDFLIEKIKRILNPQSSGDSCNPAITDRAQAVSGNPTCAAKTFEIRTKRLLIQSSVRRSNPQ